MRTIVRLKNTVHHYAWGSRTAIASLMSTEPSGLPEAELWIGSHPANPSFADCGGGKWVGLDALIQRDPEGILGRRVSERFKRTLPFLLKVLAAAEPLSIQAHPDRASARAGFSRETREGIPLDAPHRSYRDFNHKPELLVALTEFSALAGFRPAAEVVEAFERVGSKAAAGALARLERSKGAEGLRDFFGEIMGLGGGERAELAGRVVAEARRDPGASKHHPWIVKLASLHPGDPGIACSLMLNLVHLRPGEGLFQPPRGLHAYLEGVGIEVMAASDNVLRGGLTAKHVDVKELMDIVVFEPSRPSLVAGKAEASGDGPVVTVYRTPAAEFELALIRTEAGRTYRSAVDRGVEVLLVTDGEGTIATGAAGEALPAKKGDSFLVPAAAPGYRVDGRVACFRVAVPDPRAE